MSTNDKSNSAPMHQKTEYKSRRMFSIAAVLLLLSFLLFLCQVINFGVFTTGASGADSLPVSIRAAYQADYGRDTQALSIPFISENILRQIIMDMPATGSPEDRMATLEVLLSLPIPTMTPDHLFPATFIPTRTIESTPSRIPSRTAVPTLSKVQTPTLIFTSTKAFTPARTSPPVWTFTPTSTATSSSTPTPTFTVTLLPTATATTTTTPTPTPTSTGVIPTETPTPTPTSTQSIPTDTPTPTPTSTVSASTDTPTPTPTPTNTPSCTLTSSGISLSDKNLEMTITNSGGSLVVITSIIVNWPDESIFQNLTEVKFKGVTIINNANDPSSPSDYPSEKSWTGTQSDLELAAFASEQLVALFKDSLQSTNFSLTVTFDNGCTLSESN